jgi:hypothetical protein
MTYNRCHDRGVVWNSTESKIVSDVVNSSERKQKVVVLREQERATIYTTKMSKQMTKGHVRDAVHMYLVN